MLALFVFLGEIWGRAGTGDYLIDVWTGENGLPNSSVTAIAQTPDGYLWVGTYNGLARFDGVRFVKFDPDNTPELKRARVRKLHVDAEGRLWISTYDGSLTSCKDGDFRFEWQGDGSFDATITPVSLRSNNIVFLLHTGELIRKQPGYGTNSWQRYRPPGASSGTLCVEDGEGVLWGRGRDQRIWRSRNGQFELLSTNASLQGTAVHTLTVDGQGRLWVGTDKELAMWNGSRFESMVPTNGEPDLNVSWVCFSTNREAWVISNERVRKVQGRQWVFEAEPCRGLFSGYQDRLGMQEDRNGAMWLYHYGRGLFHIRRDGQTRQLDLEENFPGERVDSFYEDREGNLWCGVDRGGLVRLRQKHFVTLIPGNSQGTDPEPVEDHSSWQGNARGAAKAAVSVAEDSEGAIWIGTYGGGLNRLFDGQWQRFSVPPGSRRSFVFGVCPGEGNRLWLSAGDEDLFTQLGTQIQNVTPPVHGVKALLAASDGRIWIGNKSGLWLWNKTQMRMFRAEDGIRRTDIRALAEDGTRAIWAGAGDGLLYRIVSNRVERFQPTDVLAGQPIWALYADPAGTIWAGTFRGGLLRFKNGRFTRYTSRDGLPDDVICQVLEDAEDRLWIGCQQGIFSVAKTNLDAFAEHRSKAVNCTAYGRYDGLPSLECSGGYQPAAWRTKDDRLLFSTLGGVVSVQPDDLAPNRLPPPVVLEDVLVDGRSIRPKSITTASGQPPLRIEPGKRQIEFRYTGLSFVSPDRVRFRYKLEGQDKDWHDAGSYRSAQYNYLRPRPYRFHVSACNNDGVWNEDGAALSFELLPYFYETTSFKVAGWVTGAALVGVAVRQIVVRRMQRRLRKLERQQAIERDRARIAQDIHDDLGAGLTQIMLLSELARREPAQEVQSHLGQISDMARGLTRAMDEIVWAVDPQHDTLTGFMDYASAFTEEFLRTAGLRCRMELPPELPIWPMDAELRYNLFLSLKEALNNVVKHAHATEVRIELRLERDSFALVVQDNGRGMSATSGNGHRDAGLSNGKPKNLRPENTGISDQDRNGVGSTAANTGPAERLASGHGLLNMEKRLRSVGGRCVVQSHNGDGTRVEMNVSIKSSASPVMAIGPGPQDAQDNGG